MKKGFIVLFGLILLILIIPALSLLSKNQQNNDYSPQTTVDVQLAPSGDIVNMTVSDYIKGVVAAEMPASYEPEALKAQAVAVHTYALRNISNQLTDPDASFDAALLNTDSTKFMAYKSISELQEIYKDNYNEYYQKISDAVDSVFYDILTYENQPILAAFHSMSGGTTEGAENIWGSSISYLQPVDSAGDENAPNYECSLKLSAENVSAKLKEKWTSIQLQENPAEWFSIQSISSSGTVTAVQVGNQTITGTELRPVMELRSAIFTVDYADNVFTFTTKGYGHGVGMSQNGANTLAQQGYTYDEILLHYYSGVTLTNLQDL